MKRTKFLAQAKQVQKAIDEAVALIKPIVLKIEKSPPSTKDHYSQYMAVLSEDETEGGRHRLALLLIVAGANVNGVRAALAILNGTPL